MSDRGAVSDAVRAWLELLHGDAPGHVALGFLDPRGKWGEQTYTARHAAVSQAAAQEVNGAQGVYVRVTTTNAKPGKKRRGSARDAAAVPGLWADVDYGTVGHKGDGLPPDEEAARKVIDTSGLPTPTVWVNSGGGLYPFWLLHTPDVITSDAAFDLWCRLSEGWQRVIATAAGDLGWQYGTGVSDLARVLRIPGTTNRKAGQARPCRIVSADGPRYTLNELAQAMMDTGRWQPSTKPAGDTSGSPGFTQPAGGMDIFDVFAEVVTYEEILTPHGWQPSGERTTCGCPTWVRPGKHPDSGISAVAHEGCAQYGRRFRCFSEAAEPLPHDKPISKAHTWALLTGDDKTAYKAIVKAAHGDGHELPGLGDDAAERIRDGCEHHKVNVRPPRPVRRVEPCDLAHTHDVFKTWLGEGYDVDALDVVLAAAAVEQLDGDPVWLQVISGAGNAKTETVNGLAGAGAVVTSTIVSEAALLSGTPEPEQADDATGGLLCKIGSRGLLVIKDFTSILSMPRDLRNQVLGALREIYDGYWQRNVGSDGGRSLTWWGRIVFIGATTTAYDKAHSVIATMGDRFANVRMDSTSSTNRLAAGRQALGNVGKEKQMRRDLAAAAGGVLAEINCEAAELTQEAVEALLLLADVVTLTRTGVEHDYRGDVIDSHAPEMPTRFAKMLGQITRGGLAIGMTKEAALAAAVRVAGDSMPPLRLAVLGDVKDHPYTTCGQVTKRLQKPRATVDRTLQALHILGLLIISEHKEQGWRYLLADHIDEDVVATLIVRRMAARLAERVTRNVSTPPLQLSERHTDEDAEDTSHTPPPDISGNDRPPFTQPAAYTPPPPPPSPKPDPTPGDDKPCDRCQQRPSKIMPRTGHRLCETCAGPDLWNAA